MLTKDGMKVAFVASLQEKKNHQFHYLAIIDLLEGLGHTVFYRHITQFNIDDISQSENLNIKFYKKVFQALKAADLVVAEISCQSISIGYIISETLKIGKPVVALTTATVPPVTTYLEEQMPLIVHQYVSIRALEEELPLLISQVEPKKEKKFNFFLPPELDEYLLKAASEKRLSKSEYLRQLLAKDQH